jgi:hypothetical protein
VSDRLLRFPDRTRDELEGLPQQLRNAAHKAVLHLLALGRHQVEDLAHPLRPAGDHVEFAGGVPGVVALHRKGQPLLHRGPRDLLAQFRSRGRLKGREGRAIQLGPFGEPVRTEIRQLVVVSGDLGVGRVKGGRPIYMLLGKAVDRGSWSGKGSSRVSAQPARAQHYISGMMRARAAVG